VGLAKTKLKNLQKFRFLYLFLLLKKIEEISEVEALNGKKRWDLFAAELRKPANYSSKYKSALQQLDSIV
jgi:hypothetical protein